MLVRQCAFVDELVTYACLIGYIQHRDGNIYIYNDITKFYIENY